jgi:hypothetical protein
MKYLSLIILLVLSLHGLSQNDNGRNLHAAGSQDRLRLNSPNVDPYMSESTPFFSDRWMKSVLLLANGKTQAGLMVKLDLFENNIYYLDDGGIENINVTPVREVILTDTTNNRVYRFIHSSAMATTGVEPGWYELLISGSSSLYKKTVKKMMGTASQKSEDEIKPLSTSAHFYILANGNLLQVKRVKEIPEILKDKKNELQEYIRTKKLGGKSENDMVSLVQYYNTLKTDNNN